MESDGEAAVGDCPLGGRFAIASSGFFRALR